MEAASCHSDGPAVQQVLVPAVGEDRGIKIPQTNAANSNAFKLFQAILAG
jgi:hypothetical protein